METNQTSKPPSLRGPTWEQVQKMAEDVLACLGGPVGAAQKLSMDSFSVLASMAALKLTEESGKAGVLSGRPVPVPDDEVRKQSAAQPGGSIERWEYWVEEVSQSQRLGATIYIRWLNSFGRRGWELVQIDNGFAYFKRRAQPAPG